MPEVGAVLGGRYRLVERLAQGGMATIWRARDEQLGRDVAVKILHPEYGRDAAFVARFRQEATAVARLSHPNIVSVYDLGTDEQGGPYIAMELVEGQDLARILHDRGTLPISAAARIALGVADALAAAHARGIIHRDIKPSNILLTVSGQVKVVDFGIARALSEAQLTLPGTTLGSVQYMSPEQARGENVTFASDIYSLGLVLFEMLTGQRAFQGDSAAATAMARLTRDVPAPSSMRADVPPAMDAIVRTATARDPTQRFGSAAAFSDAVGRFLSGANLAAAPAAAIGALAATPADAAATIVSPPARAAGVTGGGRRLPPREDPDVGEEPADGSRFWTWAAGILGLLVLLAAGALVVILLRSPGGNPAPSPGDIPVPNVIGQSAAQAQDRIERAGLVYRLGGSTPDPSATSDTVVSQDPQAGTKVAAGTTVTVVLKIRPGAITVPDVRFKPEVECIATILRATLQPGTKTEQFDPVVPTGQCIGTNPPTGVQVDPNTRIDYLVSKGPQPTPTPSPTPVPTPPPTPPPTPTPSPPPTPTPSPTPL